MFIPSDEPFRVTKLFVSLKVYFLRIVTEEELYTNYTQRRGADSKYTNRYTYAYANTCECTHDENCTLTCSLSSVSVTHVQRKFLPIISIS